MPGENRHPEGLDKTRSPGRGGYCQLSRKTMNFLVWTLVSSGASWLESQRAFTLRKIPRAAARNRTDLSHRFGSATQPFCKS